METTRVDSIIDSYGADKSSLLAILQDIQGEEHWLPREAMTRVCERVGVSLSHVYRLATFFQAFSLEPRGKHICTVCMGTACHVRGAPMLVDKLERDLEIPAGGTTEDLEYTLETVNCVGACALGPLVIVDSEYHGNMNSTKLDKVLKQLGHEPHGADAVPEE
jgi:NADH-quinone oxidoreductase subunit E